MNNNEPAGDNQYNIQSYLQVKRGFRILKFALFLRKYLKMIAFSLIIATGFIFQFFPSQLEPKEKPKIQKGHGTISLEGIKKLKKDEGYYRFVYDDRSRFVRGRRVPYKVGDEVKGTLTVGVGLTGEFVQMKKRIEETLEGSTIYIDDETLDIALKKALVTMEDAVNVNFPFEMTQDMFDTLVNLTFQAGQNTWANSNAMGYELMLTINDKMSKSCISYMDIADLHDEKIRFATLRSKYSEFTKQYGTIERKRGDIDYEIYKRRVRHLNVFIRDMKKIKMSCQTKSTTKFHI